MFRFSRRKGTRADRMPEQVPEEIKKQRSEQILALTEEDSRTYRERLIGRTVEVLMEEAVWISGVAWQTGHTREYVRVAVPEEQPLANQMLKVRVAGVLSPDMMSGTRA